MVPSAERRRTCTRLQPRAPAVAAMARCRHAHHTLAAGTVTIAMPAGDACIAGNGRLELPTRPSAARSLNSGTEAARSETFCRFDSPGHASKLRVPRAIRWRRSVFEIRTGIHTGECEIDGITLAGTAVYVAARIQPRRSRAKFSCPRRSRTLLSGRPSASPARARGISRAYWVAGDSTHVAD